MYLAKRFGKEGYLYQAKVKKEDVIAYKNERNEAEVVVDYNKIYDVKIIYYSR